MQEFSEDDGGSQGGSLNPRHAEDIEIARAAVRGCEFAKALVVAEANLLRTNRRDSQWWEDAVGDWVHRFLNNPKIIRRYSGEVSLRGYLSRAIKRQLQSLRRSEEKHHNLELLRTIRPSAFRSGERGVLNARSLDAAEARRAICEHFEGSFFGHAGPGRPAGLAAAVRAGLFEALKAHMADVRAALVTGTRAYHDLVHIADALLELLGWIELCIARKSERVKRYLATRAEAARAEAYSLELALRAA
jgi:hypothetical protein